MNLMPHLDLIRSQLAALGALGGEESAQLIERIGDGLELAWRLALQNAVVAAAEEITGEISPGSVDVRLRGLDLDFVISLPDPQSGDVTATSSGPDVPPTAGRAWDLADPSSARDSAAADAAAPAGVSDAAASDAGTARISFRPPEQLKARIEEAADRAGLSVNAFLVATLAAALAGQPARRPVPGRASASGWFM